MEALKYIGSLVQFATVSDVLDILIVAVLLYELIKLIRNTSAFRPLKGVLVIVIIMQLSDWAGLHVINYLFQNLMNLATIALVVIFQPELRKVLDQFGRTRVRLTHGKPEDEQALQMAILQTVEAATSLSFSKTGALIVFEEGDNISNIIGTGSTLDANVNAELLKNLFYNKAPLHDGAVVVRSGRIAAAGCLLPLSGNLNISKDLGTRHRAALGMSENYDSVCVVVSEETGGISFAKGGILKRNLTPETLERLLTNELLPEQGNDEGKGLLNWLKGMVKRK